MSNYYDWRYGKNLISTYWIDISNMVGFCISKRQASGTICLTTLLLLNINTVHCITSLRSTLRKGSQTFSLNTNVTASATHSENQGKIIILILFNRRLKLMCWLIDLASFMYFTSALPRLGMFAHVLHAWLWKQLKRLKRKGKLVNSIHTFFHLYSYIYFYTASCNTILKLSKVAISQ